MGREARCDCVWPGGRGAVSLHLDADGLRVRGAWKASIPLAAARDVRAVGASLCISVGDDRIAFELGVETARRWAAALVKPPPTLAHKLGIDAATARVLVLGRSDDADLEAVLAQCRRVRSEPTIVVCHVETASELAHASDEVAARAPRAVLWIVYPKGRSAALGEAQVRAFLRDRNFVDTKVASVSQRLTALRFIRRSEAAAAETKIGDEC